MPEPLTNKVMAKIDHDHLKIRPRWHFAALSALMITGIVALTILASYIVNLLTVTYKLRDGVAQFGLQYRLEQDVSNFPWLALIILVVVLILAIALVRRYSHFYRWGLGWLITAIVVLCLILGIAFALTPYGAIGGQHRYGPASGVNSSQGSGTGNGLRQGHP